MTVPSGLGRRRCGRTGFEARRASAAAPRRHQAPARRTPQQRVASSGEARATLQRKGRGGQHAQKMSQPWKQCTAPISGTVHRRRERFWLGGLGLSDRDRPLPRVPPLRSLAQSARPILRAIGVGCLLLIRERGPRGSLTTPEFSSQGRGFDAELGRQSQASIGVELAKSLEDRRADRCGEVQ